MISLQDIAMSFGSQVLFNEVNIQLNPNERYGIVGANGTGKSTLLKLISGEEETDVGTIATKKDATIGWLKQDQYLYEEEPILHVVMRGRKRLWDIFEKKEKLLEREVWDDRSTHLLSEYEEEISKLDGYAAESQAHAVLKGLGIDEARHLDSLRTLSGGYKLRILLARALFTNPDILLLDEPTNYLDIVTIAWLEKFLCDRFRGTVLTVSHDHYFLNRTSTHILDIDYGEIRIYTGNYDQFVKQKQLVEEQKQKERKGLEKYVAKQRVFIEKFRYKPSKSRQALSREKQLEKLEWPDLDHTSRKAPNLAFKPNRPSGKTALKAKQLAQGFNDHLLFQKWDWILERGEKIALIGPNGIGKSTLLKTLVGMLAPKQGVVELGHNIEMGYFAQETHEQVAGNSTLIDWLTERASGTPEPTLRKMLGRVLFSDDEIYKPIEALSGGEKARAVLAHLMLQGPNFLVLDEPTNHLDLESREALAKALSQYPGTILFVSHDRHFIDLVAGKFLAFVEGEILPLLGSYDSYLELIQD